MASLLETYAKRVAVAEEAYSKAHMNESLSQEKKLATVKCLENINKFMNESFENSVGTQKADMGAWKRFTLDLTNVAIPNLIAYDLVMVQPMSSMTGYIMYVKYTAGSNKGNTKRGDVFNDPFKLGKVDTEYTSDRVVENFTATAGQTDFTVMWGPVVEGQTKVTVDGVETQDFTVEGNTIKLNAAPGADKVVRIGYVYDNVVIPQNDLPLLNAETEGIALAAKARRIAVYYSNIAAFQAKTDYGFDLGAQLAEKAVAQLNYEIDTEITDLLIDNASQDGDLVWSKTLPQGVSKQEHYAGFSEVIEDAKRKIYDRTKRHQPNYMLISSSLLPILAFVPDFTRAPANSINGPYYAGTLLGLKVFVTPNIEAGKFVLGVNNGDLNTSAAVYAPYMPIVPTQLLGFADGGMSQGWATLYDLKLLNKDLLVSGRVTA